jgi:hypothetical protein
MLEYSVTARRIDIHGSQARTKEATITLDTDVNGRPMRPIPGAAFGRVAACMIKGRARHATPGPQRRSGSTHGVRQTSAEDDLD